ncbi:50S ribosomal protein L11 methyltransferase [Lacticaseibacillus sharpeae]|uniref:Ribosomal protein L11 methyltransferase n=1 Tax=Lacticaseibacillus sharpeae JCM 1186 = DSM 20505 TaxID=1291052 RepID=A0A0R1ZM70_9LACO|nr:50S ribosomal protein L11 methyltransferase [Lacticaseibacillus sharpeae]KRM56093.1 ribosomal protein L11 methyltransferase [Lacticaseibacillus sharpeae JCM 1186 = DSM 20505]
MEWQMITADTLAEAIEPISNLMLEHDAEGIQIADQDTDPTLADGHVRVTGYFPPDVAVPERVADIQQRVSGLTAFGINIGAGTVSADKVADASWAHTWEQYYHAERVTRYLTVVPQWEDYVPSQAGEIPLILDPGQAFGTGTHPTTRLTLGLLETVLRGGEEVIDVGTGSGVLAIAAMRMGAKHVLATDIDDVAVASAQKNIALNPVDNIDVIASDLLNGVQAQADLVLANMLPVVLVPLMAQIPAVLKPHGHLLLSGIITEQEANINAALTANGLTVVERRQEGDWLGLHVMRKQVD